jgi:thymidylate synthase
MYTLNKFNNAEDAFEYYYFLINHVGLRVGNTKMLDNVGFKICNPLDNDIKTSWRKFNKEYAEYEFNWYVSKNRSVEDIKQRAKIWDTMHNGDNIVNSNYGWQWSRNNQLDYVVSELERDNNSRRAVITIYDGKEHDQYKYDTPCTLSIIFCIQDNKLCMTVTMRSNDLVYGFCNDQYCFSRLQHMVALRLNKEVGWYYHFAQNLHIYEKHFKLHERKVF